MSLVCALQSVMAQNTHVIHVDVITTTNCIKEHTLTHSAKALCWGAIIGPVASIGATLATARAVRTSSTLMAIFSKSPVSGGQSLPSGDQSQAAQKFPH